MPVYLSQVAYTAEHFAAMTKQPVDRTEAVRAIGEKLGCRLVSFYYSFGDYDGVTIFEAPDETAMTAVLLAAIGAGHIRAIKTTQLLAPKDAVEAMRRAGAAEFSAPGGAA
jgi:uncharacterized protein with GYD domain